MLHTVAIISEGSLAVQMHTEKCSYNDWYNKCGKVREAS